MTNEIKKNDSAVYSMHQARPKVLVRNIVVITVLTVLIGWSLQTLRFRGLNANGILIARSILDALVKPNLDWLLNFGSGTSIPRLMMETVGIAFLGTTLGALIAVPFAFSSARNIVGNRYAFGGNTIINAIRTFPIFVTGLMFIRVTGPGPFAGVLTIGIASIGMISKLYIEVIEDMDKGILQALDATGATPFQKIRYGIFPQLTANFLSIAIYRFEINVRFATILGLVGAGGIGFTLLAALAAYRWTDVAAALWGIVIVVLFIEFISTWIRKKIVVGE